MPDPLYSGHYAHAATITPSDTVPLSDVRGILALTTGNVVARFRDDQAAAAAVTFPVVAGTVYPFCLRYVYITGTTATMLGLR
jgi:hypothetical protein